MVEGGIAGTTGERMTKWAPTVTGTGRGAAAVEKEAMEEALPSSLVAMELCMPSSLRPPSPFISSTPR